MNKILPDGAVKFVVARVVVFDERTVVRRILRLCAHGTDEDSDGEHDVPGNVVSRGEAKPGTARRLDMNIPDAIASPKDDGARRQLLISSKSISTVPIRAGDDAKAIYGESKGPAFNTRSKAVSFEMNSTDTNILIDETYCPEALNFDDHHITNEEKHMERWFVFALQAGLNNSSVPTTDQQTLQRED